MEAGLACLASQDINTQESLKQAHTNIKPDALVTANPASRLQQSQQEVDRLNQEVRSDI
jgi:hypothetical protein